MSSVCYLINLPHEIFLLILNEIRCLKLNLIKTCKRLYFTYKDEYDRKYKNDDIKWLVDQYFDRNNYAKIYRILYGPIQYSVIEDIILKYYRRTNFAWSVLIFDKIPLENKFNVIRKISNSMEYATVKNISNLCKFMDLLYSNKKIWQERLKTLLLGLKYNTKSNFMVLFTPVYVSKNGGVDYTNELIQEIINSPVNLIEPN